MQEINISYFAVPGIVKNMPKTPEIIINSVCNYFNLSKEQLNSSYRKREWVTARHIAMYLLKQQTDLTLKNIGLRFSRDHTTVIHVMQKIDGFIYIGDEPTITAIEKITNNIRTNN